jgi:hypothetical protein
VQGGSPATEVVDEPLLDGEYSDDEQEGLPTASDSEEYSDDEWF